MQDRCADEPSENDGHADSGHDDFVVKAVVVELAEGHNYERELQDESKEHVHRDVHPLLFLYFELAQTQLHFLLLTHLALVLVLARLVLLAPVTARLVLSLLLIFFLHLLRCFALLTPLGGFANKLALNDVK